MENDLKKIMAKMIILCFMVIGICDAGVISGPFVYSQFPYLNTVYHGEGATSYQNVHFQNHGSVPIPKDLQVDDGHSYHIHAHDELEDTSVFDSIPHSHELMNRAIVDSETSYVNVAHHLDLPSHYDSKNYHEFYDNGVEYE